VCIDDANTLYYFFGTQNPDGSCTWTQATDDGGTVNVVTLKCGGWTSGDGAWSQPAVHDVAVDLENVPLSCDST
jgi:hypothetical protein